MKLLRSRIRLVSLLTACAFLLVIVFCTVSALREAGVSVQLPAGLPGVSTVSPPEGSPAPESPLPDVSPEAGVPSASPDAPDAPDAPEVTTEADPEYNLYGL